MSFVVAAPVALVASAEPVAPAGCSAEPVALRRRWDQ